MTPYDFFLYLALCTLVSSRDVVFFIQTRNVVYSFFEPTIRSWRSYFLCLFAYVAVVIYLLIYHFFGYSFCAAFPFYLQLHYFGYLTSRKGYTNEPL